MKIIRLAISRWIDHDGPRLGAALAFYTLLSLAPFLFFTVALLSNFVGKQAVQGEIVFDSAMLMGPGAAATIADLLKVSRPPEHGILASLFGGVLLLFGASAVFSELTDALNSIAGAHKRPTGFVHLLREKLFSFVLVLATGVLITITLLASTIAGRIGHLFHASPLPTSLFAALNFLVSMITVTLLFGLIFRFVPDVAFSRKTAWTGALITALLFITGKALLGAYLSWSGVGTAYGAAGSLVAVLVWVYYSAQIFYLGAEITYVCGQHFSNNLS